MMVPMAPSSFILCIMAVIEVVDLGLIEYEAAWNLQKAIIAAKRLHSFPNTLLLVEHPPVYTIGRRGGAQHLLVPRAVLAGEGISVLEIERGGDITFHGPGQLVGYPILDLHHFRPDVHFYLRQLEEVLIETLRAFGIVATRQPGLTGVWVGEKKVAAIGIHVQSWITMHGFALNVTTDLSYFDRIIPCGIQGRSVGSMAHWLGDSISLPTVAETLVDCFGAVFGATMRKRSRAAMEAALSLSVAGDLSGREVSKSIS